METVECIVVGGGLAGLSAAYGLAEAGMEVMVLERGDYSGAKNVTGGRLYVKPVRGMYPELWDEAPFERPVARELVTMLADGAHTTIEIASDRFLEGEPQSYTVVRAKLDQWLAEKVMEKGAMVVPNMKVDELLRKDGRVIGIKAGGDEIGANVVVVAEGVLRLLSSAAGLRGRAAGEAPRARLQGDHRAAGRRDRRPLAPQPRRGRRPALHGRLHARHDGRRVPLHQQGEHLARHGRGHGGHAHAARRHGELAAPRRVQGAAPDPAAGRRRHRGRVLGARHTRGRHQPGAAAGRRRLPRRRRHRRSQPQRPRHRARHGLRRRLGLLRGRGDQEGQGGR